MTRPNPTIEFEADELNRQFLTRMSILQKAIAAANETAALEVWHETRKLVESLPLATDQYDRAVNRLSNCRRYLISSEFGAAVYELKLLVGALELRKAEIPKPKRQSNRRQTPVVFQPIENPVAKVSTLR